MPYTPQYDTFEGDRYAETESLEATQIARLMRADIKTAIANGKLPRGLKVAVRTDSYSMGCSIELTITAFPGSVLNPAWVALSTEHPHDWWLRVDRDHPGFFRWTLEVREALAALEKIHRSYQRSVTESASDYYNVRYAGGVQVGARLK